MNRLTGKRANGHMPQSNKNAEWIEDLITEFVSRSPENRLGPDNPEPAFDAPLVGFSSGADPLYQEYVAHIGDFYLTPISIFQQAFPQSQPAAPGDLTVISWILPSTAAVRREQAGQAKRPSERWVRVRYYGEAFNNALRRRVVEALSGQGIQAVAPMLADFWQRMDQGAYAPCSNWSERHAAHASGLGTFGLCDGLITPKGKAMRTGSVVARVDVPATERPYRDHRSYCLYFTHNTCGRCIQRCPVNALDAQGHDKQRCQAYTEGNMPAFAKQAYGIEIPACGLCQVDVPCMDHIPLPEEGAERP
jgi:epoxyqueuosine reductase